MSGKVIHAADVTGAEGTEGIRAALVDAFAQVRAAVAAEQRITLVVPADDLLGHRGPERGAYVGALVGIARAVAFEGARAGRRINVLAVPSGTELSDAEVDGYIADGLSGQVVTVGTALIGKVAP
ncbi:hypothetical protein ACFVT5_07115 [Streptomyces sp. NPDC058001]|uniref:hypothetical protein n=1 Tax=Streptomyces sp. NPDC058001 TaxID=3346300 RepID=UPI0036E9018B